MSDQVGAAPIPRGGRRPARGGIGARLRPLTPYLLMAPTMLFLAYFLFWPALEAFGVAFRTASGTWSLTNVQALVRDTDFGLSVRNTCLFLAMVIPLELAVALAMAALAQCRLRGRGFFLYVWSFPLAISDLAGGLVWLSIFTSHGYLNSALQDLHLSQHPIGFLDYDNLPGLLLGVRAENIAVSHERGDRALPAEVDVVEPLGSHLLLTLALGGQRLKATARADFAVELHDQVWLRLDESSVRVLGRLNGGALALPDHGERDGAVIASPTRADR